MISPHLEIPYHTVFHIVHTKWNIFPSRNLGEIQKENNKKNVKK